MIDVPANASREAQILFGTERSHRKYNALLGELPPNASAQSFGATESC